MHDTKSNLHEKEREPFVLTEEATIRIFMAPRQDETGRRFTMEEQRKLFFAMDQFAVKCS
jgi:hypothetical protein